MTWLTIKQAAEKLQVSPGTVRCMIQAGRLKAAVVGSGTVRLTHRIPAESLENIVEAKERAPEPKPVARNIHPAIAKAMGL